MAPMIVVVAKPATRAATVFHHTAHLIQCAASSMTHAVK
jgi:hypothetical protein